MLFRSNFLFGLFITTVIETLPIIGLIFYPLILLNSFIIAAEFLKVYILAQGMMRMVLMNSALLRIHMKNYIQLSLALFTFMHWRRKWQSTPVFLPGGSQGWRSLVGCHLWGPTESDMTEVT